MPNFSVVLNLAFSLKFKHFMFDSLLFWSKKYYNISSVDNLMALKRFAILELHLIAVFTDHLHYLSVLPNVAARE